MTNLNNNPHNIIDPEILHARDQTLVNSASLFQAVLRLAMELLARFSRARGPKTRRALEFTLCVLLILHGGTHEEKRTFLRQLIAEHNEKMTQLGLRYRIWRQRKCWMWGGGYYGGAIGALSCNISGTRPVRSHEALIPD